MKIAILGADGLLGRACRGMPGDVIAFTRAAADLTRPLDLRAALVAIRPAVVVNCASYTHVDGAESEPAAAFAVNAYGVRDLAIVCRDLDCTLVHVSTDYVFGQDDARSTPYDESDTAGPISVYGNSKLAGEHFVRAICAKHFILRTCGLYDGQSGFVAALLRKASEGQPIRVVNDQVCTPTAAIDVAHAITELLTSPAFGLYHVTNEGACSWFDFAQAIFEIARIQAPLVPISSAEYGAIAKRPRYSVLNGAKRLRLGLPPMWNWHKALKVNLSGDGQSI